MRLGATFIVPVFLTLSAWSQLTFTIPVQDKSEAGTPLEISGTISFTESISANSITAASEYEVKARNISEKEIVLLVASFEEAGPHGGSRHHILQFDDAFRAGIGPGQSFILSRSDRASPSFCCINLLSTAEQPKAEVQVRFVQFSDGSTFGDKDAAKDIFAIQTAVLDRLRALDATQNDQEFLQILRQRMEPDEADNFFEAIRRTQKEKGTAAARSRVRTGLVNSEKHLAQITIEEAADK
ncbi:MAG TPA: hypothetical protein VEV41_05710 [Terriglobales bacterium]|nr:hypothetical protein [Terriglobales bacterium]